MLQAQQQLIDQLRTSQEQPFPEELAAWADNPVTKYFLNNLQATSLATFIDMYSTTLERDCLITYGYEKAVADIEETIDEFRKMTETEGGEDE